MYICRYGSTTDGGSRLFVSSLGLVPNQIMAVDVSSCRWKCLTTLPTAQSRYCIEWHGGLLYVAGGTRANEDHTRSVLNSLHAFNETTGAWEELPPMPYACTHASSGVIGDQLVVVGGYCSEGNALLRLQIYDIGSRTWRLGTAPPRGNYDRWGVVVDGKLLLLSQDSPMSVYDPHSDSWTFEEVDWSVGRYVVNACVHESRMIGFSRRAGYVDQWERATDGSWSLSSCEVDTSGLQDFVSESVILG